MTGESYRFGTHQHKTTTFRTKFHRFLCHYIITIGSRNGTPGFTARMVQPASQTTSTARDHAFFNLILHFPGGAIAVEPSSRKCSHSEYKDISPNEEALGELELPIIPPHWLPNYYHRSVYIEQRTSTKSTCNEILTSAFYLLYSEQPCAPAICHYGIATSTFLSRPTPRISLS